MTLDQIWFRLCDINILSQDVGARTSVVNATMAASELKPDQDGFVRGRAADGTPIKAKIGGKSLARRLMEAEEERKRLEAMTPRERRAEARKARALKRQERTGGN